MSEKTPRNTLRVLTGPKDPDAGPHSEAQTTPPTVEQFEKLVHNLAAYEASQPEGTVSLTRARVASLDELASGQRVKLKTKAEGDAVEEDSPPPANVTIFSPKRKSP
jgi:hypothetical protein